MGATDTKILNSEWTKTPSGYEGVCGRFMVEMVKGWPPKSEIGSGYVLVDASSKQAVDEVATKLICHMPPDDKADIIMRTLFGDEWAMSDDPLVEEALGMVQAALRKREGK